MTKEEQETINDLMVLAFEEGGRPWVKSGLRPVVITKSLGIKHVENDGSFHYLRFMYNMAAVDFIERHRIKLESIKHLLST